jgi:hypothetical protein
MRVRRVRYGVLIPLLVITVSAAAVRSASAGPQPAPVSGDAEPVIVVLADQHDEAPATAAGAGHRRALAVADQQPLIDQVRAAGATGVRQFSIVNAFAATVPAAERERLSTDPLVRAVVPDRVTRLPRRQAGTAVRAGATPICPSSPAKPLLEPEALDLIDAVRAQNLTTGRRVKVGFVADAFDVNNPDLVRPDGTHVVTDFQDFISDPAFTGDELTAIPYAYTIG